MAINIKRQPESKNQRIAEENIYVDANGKRVPADSPDASIKVAVKGQPISAKVAKRYNLFAEESKPAPPVASDSADSNERADKRQKRVVKPESKR